MKPQRLFVCFGIVAVVSGCAGAKVAPVTPVEGEAVDATTAGVATVDVALALSTSSGNPVDPSSFRAELSLNGGAFADIAPAFSVTTTSAEATLPGMPIGVYTLKSSVADTAGMRDPDLILNFTVEYPAASFVGGEVLFASAYDAQDGCFGGAINFLFPPQSLISIFDLPSFAEVQADSPKTLLVRVPPALGDLQPIQIGIEHNALVFLPRQLPPVDLSALLGGQVPCVLTGTIAGRFLRTSENEGNIRLFFFNMEFDDPLGGGTCWLPDPLPGCVSSIDLGGFVP